MTADGSKTYSWDAENRLVRVAENSQEIEFGYDSFGRRATVIERSDGIVTSTRRLLRCSSVLCEERDASGSLVLKSYFDQGLMVGDLPLYYARDYLGSVRDVTDSGGVVRSRYEFDPFGRRSQVQGDVDSTLGFTGHETYAMPRLVATHYRLYDPDLARWLSEDRVAPAEGDNLYGYVSGNPLNRVDPDGAAEIPPAVIKMCKRVMKIGGLVGAAGRVVKVVDCGSQQVKCLKEGDKRCNCANPPDIREGHTRLGPVDYNAGPRRDCIKGVEECCKENFYNCVKSKLTFGKAGGSQKDCFGDIPPCDPE